MLVSSHCNDLVGKKLCPLKEEVQTKEFYLWNNSKQTRVLNFKIQSLAWLTTALSSSLQKQHMTEHLAPAISKQSKGLSQMTIYASYYNVALSVILMAACSHM